MEDNISRFFRAYAEWYDSTIAIDSSELALADDETISWVRSLALTDPLISEDRLQSLTTHLNEGRRIPDVLRKFLLTKSYGRLETALMDFPATDLSDGLKEIDDLYATFGMRDLVPFAYSKDGSGLYCLDIGKHAENPPVCAAGYDLTSGSRMVATTFESILDFLIEILLGADRDALEERAAVFDPNGIKGPAWETWWLGQLVFLG